MSILRSVVLNPVEPSPLSFRLPLGMDTRLNVTFFNQSGVPHSVDLGSQLQLTGRSSGRTTTYLLPATDIVNGRARAFIPGADLDDPNGWRLRLVGTLNSEAALLAVGTVVPVAAAGLEAIPEDIIDTVDLSFLYDKGVDLDVTVWHDAGKGSPYDLTDEGTLLTASIYNAKGGAVLVPFTVTVLHEHKVRLSLSVEQVNALPVSCWWSMTASTAAGATTLCEGSVSITGIITPPLLETTAAYEYLKPDDLNPVGGQIIHGNFTRNVLKVAKTTQALVDFSATLALVKPGDLIIIDVVTWTVLSVLEESGWYEFTVAPITQAAVSGVTSVTFKPPDPL